MHFACVYYCPTNHVYSDLFAPDHCGIDSRSIHLTAPLQNQPLYEKITSFVENCKTAIIIPTYETINILCTVDVLCLLRVLDEESEENRYDTENPLILLDEMGNFWSAKSTIGFSKTSAPSDIGETDAVQMYSGSSSLANYLQRIFVLKKLIVRFNFGKGTRGGSRAQNKTLK